VFVITTSGVTRRLRQGVQTLAEEGPLTTAGGPTSQHTQKS